MAIAAILLFSFRNDIGPLFVDDAQVGREVAGVAPICAAYQMPDGVYGVASGVLRYSLFCLVGFQPVAAFAVASRNQACLTLIGKPSRYQVCLASTQNAKEQAYVLLGDDNKPGQVL